VLVAASVVSLAHGRCWSLLRWLALPMAGAGSRFGGWPCPWPVLVVASVVSLAHGRCWSLLRWLALPVAGAGGRFGG